MTKQYVNRAWMTTATTGTGTITLGSATSGEYFTFAEAGMTNANTATYVIIDGTDVEIGVGTYTSSGTTFSRDTVTASRISGTAGTSKINLSGSATIFLTEKADDVNHNVSYHIRQSGVRTFTSNTSEQAIFNTTTNGALTLEAGWYEFVCLLSIDQMSATSGNAAFDILGAGTAVLTDVLYQVIGSDGDTATNANRVGQTSITAQSAASMLTPGTGTELQALITGSFEISTPGTIIPSLTLVTAAAVEVRAGSYFKCRHMLSDFQGPWT